jgi:hypothetical protein
MGNTTGRPRPYEEKPEAFLKAFDDFLKNSKAL